MAPVILKTLKPALPTVVSEPPFAVFRFTSKPFCHSHNIFFSSSQVLQAVLKVPGSSLASSCSKYSVSAPLNSEGISRSRNSCPALYSPPPVEEYLLRDSRDGASCPTPAPRTGRTLKAALHPSLLTLRNSQGPGSAQRKREAIPKTTSSVSHSFLSIFPSLPTL